MLTDAHCHPFDLNKLASGAEEERQGLGVCCAASATDLAEFAYHEELSRQAKARGAPPMLPCFALHPQLPAYSQGRGSGAVLQAGLETLETLARTGRLCAVGETGFDLFNAVYRQTEHIQDELFTAHVNTALAYNLPLVLHIRRAMHKVFRHTRALKKCRAVIFHSWSGTAGEGEALLRRGVTPIFPLARLSCSTTARQCAAAPVFP
jgi:TatD DNase family protein